MDRPSGAPAPEPAQEAPPLDEESTILQGELLATAGSERLDWVLQESNIETTQTYLSALLSHKSYWSSKDAILFMLRKVLEPD